MNRTEPASESVKLTFAPTGTAAARNAGPDRAARNVVRERRSTVIFGAVMSVVGVGVGVGIGMGVGVPRASPPASRSGSGWASAAG